MAALLVAAGMGAKLASTVATVASVAATGVSALATVSSANNQAAVMEGNAAFQEQSAKDARVAASVEAERMRRSNRLLLSRQRAGTAQAGALSGTSLDLLDQNSVAAELDALTVQYGADQRARSIEAQAGLTRAEAGMVRSSGYTGAAGDLIGGLAATPIDPLNFSKATMPRRTVSGMPR